MSQMSFKQRFKSIPSLPMFMIERDKNSGQMNISSGSLRSDVGQQSQETGMSFATQSASDINSSIIDSEYPHRPERRSRRKSRSGMHSEGKRDTDELLVHVHGTSKPNRPAHKPRRKHKPPINIEEEITTELTFVGRSSDELEQANKGIHRDSVHSSSLRKSLAKEVERLTLANKELTEQLHEYEVNQDSGYQQAVPVLKRDEYDTKLLEQLSQFEHEYRVLEKERNHYKNELAATQKKDTASPILEGNSKKIESLQSQNRDLNEDVLLLKNLVYRLNLELERYQERLRKCGAEGRIPDDDQDRRDLPEGSAKLDRGTLSQLLEAYDETVNEKDDLIRNYEKDINTFTGKCKEVVAENEKLHQAIQEYRQKAEEATEGFSVLHHDASIAQEQNDLLINQLQIQKDKVAEVHAVYRQKVSELTSKNEELVEIFQRSRGDLLTMKGSYSVLREEYDKQRADADTKVPYAVHTASVAECRRLLDELKAKYDAERAFLAARLDEMAAERPGIEERLVTLRAENGRLEVHVQTLDRLLKKCQEKCEAAQTRWVTTKVSKDALKRQLQKAISFANELVQEQENLLKQLHTKQEETDSMAKISSSLVNRMGTLKSNLKNVQKGAWQELDVIEKRISEQESGVGRMKEEYRRETMRLQNLVKQKEDIIERLQKEKTKTEENLEVVWKAVTGDESRTKEARTKPNAAFAESYSDDKF